VLLLSRSPPPEFGYFNSGLAQRPSGVAPGFPMRWCEIRSGAPRASAWPALGRPLVALTWSHRPGTALAGIYRVGPRDALWLGRPVSSARTSFPPPSSRFPEVALAQTLLTLWRPVPSSGRRSPFSASSGSGGFGPGTRAASCSSSHEGSARSAPRGVERLPRHLTPTPRVHWSHVTAILLTASTRSSWPRSDLDAPASTGAHVHI
jgi:hypothetical protein